MNHIKYKQPNAPSHLHILRLNLDEANHSFLFPVCLRGNRFLKNHDCSLERGTGA